MATIHKAERLSPTVRAIHDDGEQEFDQLINSCIDGDRLSQQRTYELFYGKMMGVCLRYTKNVDQAKDILQDGFIKVFRNMEKFNRRGSFEGWIRRIMVNTAIDHFRKSKNSYLLLGEDRSMEEFADEIQDKEEDEPDWGLMATEVINAMQKLSPAYRTVFNLYIFEEHTHKEIAEILGISVGTSKSNLAKAKNNLKKLLRRSSGSIGNIYNIR